MSNLERLNNTLIGLKEIISNNTLHNLNEKNDKNDVILQTAITMTENNIANGAIYNVSYPAIIPSSTQLTNNIFTSNVAIFNTYLVQLAYKIDVEVPLNTSSLKTTDASISAVINFLLKLLPAGTKNIKPLIYNCMNILDNKNKWGGFIMEFNDASFIALRGTVYACEVYEDTKALLYIPNWVSNCKVHGGFNNIYSFGPLRDNIKSLRLQIWEYLNITTIKKLFVSGHSLGAAIMYLLEADITNMDKINLKNLRNKTNFYSIAGPYTGDKDFIKIIMSTNVNRNYTGTFSIINTDDLVPNKGLLSYARVPYQLFCFKDPKLTTLQSHFIDNYRKNLENKAISNVFDIKASSGYASCGPISCTNEPRTTFRPITKVKISEDGEISLESSNQNYIIILIVFIFAVLFGLLYLFRDKIRNLFNRIFKK